MTNVRLNDTDAVRRLLANAEALLLDFDGPVCSVFAGLPAPVVVDQLCVVLADGGYGDPPPDVAKSADPFDVLEYAATLGENEARYVNAALTAYEVEAIATAEPTPGAHDLIRIWSITRRPLAIVSNNSALAIEVYLNRHDLDRFVQYVSGRRSPDPTLLKPNTHLLRLAFAMMGNSAERSTLIGDSTTDIEAARAVGACSIGYANKPGKIVKLADSGADVVITDMAKIADIVPGV